MADIVDYWFRYHLVKVATASALLIVLVLLGVILWRTALNPSALASRTRNAAAWAGSVVALLALASAVLVAANIQGAVAPFSSLLPMLPTGATHGDLTTATTQITQHLTHYPTQTDAATPAVKVMVDDFGTYHAAMGVLGTIMTLVLITLSATSWRRYATNDKSNRRTKRTMLWFASRQH